MQAKLFTDTTVMITGASSGFGAETARLFAKEGARLILVARRQERLEELQRELNQRYQAESTLIVGNVADYALMAEQIQRIESRFGMPHILVNNAGLVRGMDKLWEVQPDAWNEMIDVNIKGVLTMTRQILPSMIQANRGHIINVGSISGHGTYPGGGVYCATKFAVRALTDTLRMELVATPIRVSLISPGMAETEFSNVRFYGDENKAKQVYAGITPLTALDIAEAIIFIASRPQHVNIADLILYPTNQASTTLIHRDI
ncbi:SDR family NAD(P)-dependent oxidoreductase [Candidatus Protochlamydia phocaeensis]|uniref:SDR family NAD(P)-dependent oxidoreductase n=1 Tax=Candidatus Protochlamydia phocaeensis TaxID=1414722 RepID=UPI00083888B6|nr:SDR family NAD(P)-dependent oxidoreductase [Candidatus Protochlamydia phocaeensis]